MKVISTATITVLIPPIIPTFSATAPIIVGIIIAPSPAKVSKKLRPIGYSLIIFPTQEIVVGYRPDIKNPTPIILIATGVRLLLEINIMKKIT